LVTEIAAQNDSVTAIAAAGAAIDTMSGAANAAVPILTARRVMPRRVIPAAGPSSSSWHARSPESASATVSWSRPSCTLMESTVVLPSQAFHTRAATVPRQ
jgi:hypothetical protein